MAANVSVNTRRVTVVAAGVAGATLFVGLLAPFLSGARFSGPIKKALETSLGRPVAFERVHFTLFSGPGVSLQDVTIGEDPRYGLEPFAFVPTLDAHIRVDKLLLGEIRFSSLRLTDASLNLVKTDDGSWNVLELVQRLGAPRRAPLNFFPALEVRNARVDFKFETRKTTLYVLDTDLTVYPERSGRLNVQFSGAPARTDRAGNGFGHLRGTANWYVNRKGAGADQFDAHITLDQSNFSEIATLLEGHDIGVHGTVSSELQITGPLSALAVQGRLRLEDVHRWDLLPSSGEDWRIGYNGHLDLVSHSLDLETLPARAGETTPVALQLQVHNFVTRPVWTMVAQIRETPARELLPLARRMGLALPPELAIEGTASGSIGVGSKSGMSGSLSVLDATAKLPNTIPLHADNLVATFSGDAVHLQPAKVKGGDGSLQVAGNYAFDTRQLTASFDAEAVRVNDLKTTLNAWFGVPPALDLLRGGELSGHLVYRREAAEPEAWSGRFQFDGSTLNPSGFSAPIESAGGRIAFDSTTFELTRLTAVAGGLALRANYRYAAALDRPERVRIDLPRADVDEIEALLRPALEPQTLLARLPFVRRIAAPWLSSRDVEGDLTVAKLSASGTELGPFTSHFVWQGTALRVTSMQLRASDCLLRGQGNVNLSSYQPRYAFALHLAGLPWGGGRLSADGDVSGYGIGSGALAHLQANGKFTGQDLDVTPDDSFSTIGGDFDLSLAEGWPKLQLSNLEAADEDDEWTGSGASQSDGRLVLDLESASRQRHIVSNLNIQRPSAVSLLQGEVAKSH